MPVEDAKYHMKRCVDSGLWVPNAADLNAKFAEKSTSSTEKSAKTEDIKLDVEKKEPIYTGVSSDDLD